jgi:plasmid stabilization system protein ParE
MPTRLEDAAKAYRRAQRAHEAARSRVTSAWASVEASRRELAEAIVEEARAGRRQKDIVTVSGYTRERVRQILREGGVEADE